MNKLTITEKVFVPVSNHKESTHWVVDTIEKNGDSYFTKEETNKYIFSEEELKDLLSKVFRAGNRRGYSGYPNTDNWTQPTEEEFINKAWRYQIDEVLPKPTNIDLVKTILDEIVVVRK